MLQSTAADVDTVLVNGDVRKRHGQLIGYDLQAVRDRANAALDRNEGAAAALPELSDADVHEWYTLGERMASKNFADACADWF